METPRLRIFGSQLPPRQAAGSDPVLEKDSSPATASDAGLPNRVAPVMPVAVRDLVPLLVDAFQTDRTWLKDFGQEQIQVSPDLYEVLLAYQQLRRNAA